MDREQYNTITGIVIGAAIEVHRELGPGLLESVYEACLTEELASRGLKVKNQVFLPILYKEKALGKNFKIDLLIEDEVIVELKSVEKLLDVHEIQLVTYLRLANKKLGLLINFNVPVLTKGVRRRINGIL